MKILFLDIDSVLNTPKYGEDLYNDRNSDFQFVEADVPLDVNCINALKHIFKEVPDLKVVWSTDWRLYNEPTFNSFKNPLIWLEAQDWMKDRVISKTPKLTMPSSHFEEIHAWLSKNTNIDVETFAILEDFVDLNGLAEFFKRYYRNKIFKCEYGSGLTIEIAEKVVKHLKGQSNGF